MRSITLLGSLAAAALVLVATASAASFFHSVRDKTAAKECGACHMAYPPALLPARSWQKIIGSLDKHFGEDASLPEPARQTVLAYYTSNAGDGALAEHWFMNGLSPAETPGRITDMHFWRSIHGGFPAQTFKRPNVRKKGNCIGCHG